MKKMKKLHDGEKVPHDTPTKIINGKRYLLTDDDKVKNLAPNHPSVTEQISMIWEVINQLKKDGNTLPKEADDMLNSILAVKNNNPK